MHSSTEFAIASRGRALALLFAVSTQDILSRPHSLTHTAKVPRSFTDLWTRSRSYARESTTRLCWRKHNAIRHAASQRRRLLTTSHMFPLAPTLSITLPRKIARARTQFPNTRSCSLHTFALLADARSRTLTLAHLVLKPPAAIYASARAASCCLPAASAARFKSSSRAIFLSSTIALSASSR